MVQAFNYIQERFTIPVGSCKFKTQFVNLYKSRIDSLKPILLKSLKEVDDTNLEIVSLTELPKDKRSLISGILYKEAPLKRNILKELAAEEKLENIKDSQLKPDRFISAEDQIYIEDEVQRICLKFPSPHMLNSLVTGIFCGIIGIEADADPGHFNVESVVFPGQIFMSHVPRPLPNVSCILGFVSGLNFPGQSVSSSPAHLMGLTLLGDWIRTCSTLNKLYICGNLIKISDASLNLPKFIARKNDAASLSAMRLFDQWLSDLPLGSNDGISVEILPGNNDCVSSMLPQQPFHSCCLPKSVSRSGRNKEALKSVTNPMLSEVHGRRIIVSSGQNVNDIMKYTDYSDHLDALEVTLKWGHLAPTCPDTLYGYPLLDQDPLAIKDDEWPDIYVVGNLNEATKPRSKRINTKGTLLVALPEFSTCQSLVLVDVSNLSVRVVDFK